MDTLDRTITDLAAAQGHTLSGKDLKVVKQALCNAYIDSVLDGTKMAAQAMSPISGSEDTDEDVEDGDDDGDIMNDDESEDNTDDKGESEKKLKATKVLTTEQPNSSSSAVTGYRPGVSGMGQVG